MHNPDTITIGIYEKALPSDITWPERLTAAAQAGFEFVEVSIDESDDRLERLNWPAARRAELRAVAADTGVRLASICLSGHRKYPMGSASPAIRQRGLDILRKAIDFAGDVGVRMVLVPGYDVFYEPGDAGTQARFLEGLRQGVVWASCANVMLALENTEHYMTSITHAMQVISALNTPWLQLYGDIGNLVGAGHDVFSELEAGRGHFAGVHVKDAVPGTFRYVPFGQGTVPFVAAFRKLWDLGFSGNMMLELWHTDDYQNAIAAARHWVLMRIEESRQDVLTPLASAQRNGADT
jgi:predicted hexulose-6-phosphate isomerase